ncbi:hypothetical protein AAFN60_19115 [Roseibacillus persicicus]|uniref:nucleotide-binding protein n=1 Tax=Roseibacillus persicicus TaxID=454148 RepID=UPI00398AA747
MKKSIIVIFLQGGKGGVGKTEVALALIAWVRSKGYSPLLLDFDIENTNKSGLQNFHPEARKLDVHAEGSLDEFFDACDEEGIEIVIADLGAGAGKATYQWFENAAQDAAELGISFTSVGVATNDAGAVQSVLKWASHLQDSVKYLTVLNEFREPNSKFDYWHSEPATARFIKAFSPHIIVMPSRLQEFQAELRNHSLTLQQVIDGKTKVPFFKKTRCLVNARRYQRDLFAGFEAASEILLPPSDS